MVVGDKVWLVSRKMVNATIEIAKKKYEKENVNAIVAVEKNGIISLQKDVFKDTAAFVKAIQNWERGGFKCYYVTKEYEVKKIEEK